MTLELLISSVIITIVPLGWTLPNTNDICWWETGWVYTEGKIYLCDLQDWNIEFYRQHEIGHLIWDKYLSKDQKKEYTKIYKKHYKRWINAFWREYSYSDVEEDFCDNYASYKTKERVNIYINKRIKIIRQILSI